jgi:hypothetical protein
MKHFIRDDGEVYVRDFSVTNYQIVRVFVRWPSSATKVGGVPGTCQPAICLLQSGQSFVPSQHETAS